MNRTWWIILAVAALIIILYFTINKAHASEDCGDWCITPIISLSPSPEDSVTPESTPTDTPEATDSAQPVYPTPTAGTGGYFDDHLGCGTHSCVGKPGYVAIPTGAPMTGRAEN